MSSKSSSIRHSADLNALGGKEMEPAWLSCMKLARAMPAAVDAHRPERQVCLRCRHVQFSQYNIAQLNRMMLCRWRCLPQRPTTGAACVSWFGAVALAPERKAHLISPPEQLSKQQLLAVPRAASAASTQPGQDLRDLVVLCRRMGHALRWSVTAAARQLHFSQVKLCPAV